MVGKVRKRVFVGMLVYWSDYGIRAAVTACRGGGGASKSRQAYALFPE